MVIFKKFQKKSLQGYFISFFTHFCKIRFGLHMVNLEKTWKTREITLKYGNFINVFFVKTISIIVERGNSMGMEGGGEFQKIQWFFFKKNIHLRGDQKMEFFKKKMFICVGQIFLGSVKNSRGDLKKIFDPWKVKGSALFKQFCMDVYKRLKSWLEIVWMRPIRRWKALTPYFSIPISLKWLTVVV